MPSITIRGVSEATRLELAARAAKEGRSMQEYLRMQLEALAQKPQLTQVLDRVERRLLTTGSELAAEEIAAWKDADRR